MSDDIELEFLVLWEMAEMILEQNARRPPFDEVEESEN